MENFVPQAEQAVIGALLLDFNRCWPAAQQLGVADFESDAHRRIFRHIKKVAANDDVDIITVGNSIERANEAELAGGLSYLSELASVALPAGIKSHVRLVFQSSIRRQALAAQDDFAAGRCSIDDLALTTSAIAAAAHADRRLPPPRKFSEIARAERIKFSFALPGLRVGNVGVFAGYGGVGKGFMALALAIDAALGHGKLTGLIFENSGKVLFLSIEDDQEALTARLQSYSRHLSQADRDLLDENLVVLSVYGLPDWQLLKRDERGTLAQNTPAIAAICEAAQNARLIILDTARKFFQFDENKSDEASLALLVCDQLARKTGAAVLLVHHLSKPAGDDKNELPSIFAIRGSSALVADARWAAILAVPPEKFAQDKGLLSAQRKRYRVFAVGKINHAGQPDVTLLRQDDEGALIAEHWPTAQPVKQIPKVAGGSFGLRPVGD